MFESHRPFIREVMSRTNEFTSSEITDYLDGTMKEDEQGHAKLAKAFEAWTHGDSAAITKALLGRETVLAPKTQ